MNNKETTPYINLRAIEPEDLDLLYKIENDELLWDTGLNNVQYSRYILHEYIANSKGDIYTDKQVRLIIENDKESVGIIDLIDFNQKNMRAESGIVRQKKHRNKGDGQAAILHIIKYAKDVLHLHQLYAYIDIYNKNSINMFKKIGFTSSLELEDWLYDGEKYHKAIIMQYFL